MARKKRIPVFGTYYRRQQIDLIRFQASRYESLVQRLLDEVLPEQKARLRVIRQSGPWDVDWPQLVRLQTERANEVILRLREQRQMHQEIRELEHQLPPRKGWQRLRYANPFAVTWMLFAVSMALNAYRLHVAGVF
jgi:hypothetical protein